MPSNIRVKKLDQLINVQPEFRQALIACGVVCIRFMRDSVQAVTIDKGAGSNRDEVYGWKASSRNLKQEEQLSGDFVQADTTPLCSSRPIE
jgi:hypothetical protein